MGKYRNDRILLYSQPKVIAEIQVGAVMHYN
jgi:hypothetical protein